MSENAENADLARLLTEPGPWTFVYVDGPGDEPQPAEASRHRSVRDRLVQLGAPPDDVDAVAEALETPTGLPSPSARYLLVRGGRVELDERFPGARRGPERLGHAPIPEILPLLRHRAADVHYLVVETGREGAQLRLERAGRLPERVEDVDGIEDDLQKVPAGGWADARHQRHAEDVWMHNQAEVAGAVDELVRERRPGFVVLAGDIRARQLLEERLSAPSRQLVIEVDAHTRAPGARDDALDAAIDAAVDARRRNSEADALDRAAVDGGRSGSRGLGEVVRALQEARVHTLVLDARLVDDERTLDALDAPPWIAEGGDDALAAGSIARLPIAEALARAAVLGSARVIVTEDEAAAPDAPRDDRPAHEPVAVLRWPD